jgi:hypothetical protein
MHIDCKREGNMIRRMQRPPRTYCRGSRTQLSKGYGHATFFSGSSVVTAVNSDSFTNLALRASDGSAPPRFSAKSEFKRLNMLAKSDLSDCSGRIVQMSKNECRVLARCVACTLTFCTLTMRVVAIEPRASERS